LTGCARVPPPPYPLNFAASGNAPRVLQTSQEVPVPIAVTNTGQRTWDPARMHLSYHWLWFLPRELASRSRTVPFHDGIRTALGAPVAPGGVSTLQARILAPSVPGLYWLQWDMVEEGATWFTQVAPRQPRRLVIVVPPAAAVVAPLPLVLAVVAIVALRRIDRRQPVRPPLAAFAATGDVWWCAASLCCKPIMLAHEALLEPTAVADWLTMAVAVLLPLAVMLVLPRRLRAWTLMGVGALGTIVILGDVIYYRFFGDILSAPAILGAHQTARVWGTIRSLLTPGLVWLLIDLPFAAWLAVRLSAASVPRLTAGREASIALIGAAAVVAIGLALSAPRVLASTPLDQMFRDRAVAEQLGAFGYHAYDAWNYTRATLLRPRASEAQIGVARAWFAERAPLRSAGPGPYGGIAAGKNLIVIQVESLQDFAVDFEVDRQQVMPHLRRWVDDGVRFTNVTDETNEGRTSDAEFAAFTSLLPLDHGAVAFRYPGNHYVGLPRVLAEHGYRTLSAVPFESGFWNRAVMHPSYGFEQSLFEPDFVLTEQIGWGLNDRDFLLQMVPRLERLPRPFAAWLITLSLHHPFEDFPDRHKVLKLGPLEGTSFGNYLHTMRFFDDALSGFRSALERDGLLKESVLAVFGDHDAGFPHDPALAKTIGIAATDIGWTMADRVPLFVRVPARDGGEAPVGFRGIAAGQTDFAPTLLALLGIDAAPLPYVGRNLLGAPGAPPVLRPYGDWLDDHHLFLSGTAAGRGCVDVAAASWAIPSACADADDRARRTRDVSSLVIVGDLQQRLRDALH
jgi:phosphoglycerol transferase MdoB-like AlkP superfamily enzyme